MSKRNLEKIYQSGSAILESHSHHSLTSTDIYTMFERCGVPDEVAGIAFRVMDYALACGIEIGSRICKKEMQKKP